MTKMLLLLLMMMRLAVGENVNSTNPGFKAIITDNGLKYANQAAIQALAKRARNAKIPDQSGKASGFHYEVKNIHVTGFNPPSSMLSLVPGSGLAWKATNAGIKMHGDFHYKKWFISDGGSFDAEVQDLSFNIAIHIGSDKTGRPTIKSRSCRSSVDRVKFRFHGGMAWLYNLFAGKVGDAIKDNLNKQMCSLITKEIDVDGAKQMAKIPMKVKLAKKFLLDYSFTKPPVFTKTYLETFHKGTVTWLSAPNETSTLVAPPMPQPRDNINMVYFGVSDYMFDMAAHVAQKHGFLKYNLTADKLPKEYRGLFNTSCTGFMPKCIGRLIPQIGKRYPGGSVGLHLISTKVPNLTIATSGMTVACAGDIMAYADLPGKPTTPFLFSLFANMTTTLKVSVNDGRIYVKIDKLSLHLEAVNSSVGSINKAFLDIVTEAIKVVVVKELNDLGAIGFPLPVTKDVKLVKTRLLLEKDTIMIATDLKYVPTNAHDVTLNAQDVFPNEDDVMGASHDVTLNAQDVFPNEDDVMGASHDVTLNAQDVVPNEDDVMGASHDVTLNAQDVVSNEDDVMRASDDGTIYQKMPPAILDEMKSDKLYFSPASRLSAVLTRRVLLRNQEKVDKAV